MVIFKEFRNYVPGPALALNTPARAQKSTSKPVPKSAKKQPKGRQQRRPNPDSEFDDEEPLPEDDLDQPPPVEQTPQQRLNEACWVVDALGQDVKGELLGWLINHQLDDYRAQFGPNKEGWAMSMAHNRFQWLRFQLVEFDKDYGSIFPKYWNVPALITREFCRLSTFMLLLGVLTWVYHP